MKPLLVSLVVVAVIGTAAGLGAEQTVTGVISDSLCAASHANMAGQVTPALSDAECTKACVDANGKFVLVDESKNVITITNQNFAGLRDHAGQRVTLVGDVKSGAMVIAKIESAEAAKQ